MEEHDPYLNPMGAKDVGEVGIVGTAAARKWEHAKRVVSGRVSRPAAQRSSTAASGRAGWSRSK
jgi:hypothetical protein